MKIVLRYPLAVRSFSDAVLAAARRELREIDLDELQTDMAALEPWKFHKLLAVVEPRPIAVIRYDGQYYIFNGKHRAWMAVIRGKQTIKAEISLL